MIFSAKPNRRSILLFSLGVGAILLLNKTAISVPTPAPKEVNSHLPSQLTPEVSLHSLSHNVRKTLLENGLLVLTKEVHTAPVVSVQVWYQVGSRNESPNVNGIAHQLEHLLFKGTESRPLQWGQLLSYLGSDSNAFTSYDYTTYINTVENHKLEALLTLEADRMENARLTPEDLALEKQVVISELQGAENYPSYRLYRALMAAAFPNHPYGFPVGGTKLDVENFTPEEVRQYYQNCYSPNNAVLVIVGDFETDSALATVEKLFGNIPRRRGQCEPAHLPDHFTIFPENSLPVILEESGSSPLIQIVYPLPAIGHPDLPALDVLDYIMDNGGRSSHLYQALVETGFASDVGSSTSILKSGGWYELFATANEIDYLAKIDEILAALIADIKGQPIPEKEIHRAKINIKTDKILRNRDITNQASQLGEDQLIAGDYHYTENYLAAIDAVTAADVQRVAQTYLQSTRRLVGFFKPTDTVSLSQEDPLTLPTFTQTHPEYLLSSSPLDLQQIRQYLPPMPAPGPSPSWYQQPETLKLPNGIEILLLPDANVPGVTLRGYIRAGEEFDPTDQIGLANLTSQTLMGGTQTKDALFLAKQLEDHGIRLWFDSDPEGVDIRGVSLSESLPILIDTLSDVLQNATFPVDQLELSRQQSLMELQENLDDPEYVAQRKFFEVIYPPDHPLHQFPTSQSLESIQPQDVTAFYHTYYRPDTVVLMFVGDFDPQQVRSQLVNAFSSWWATGEIPIPQWPSVLLPEQMQRFHELLPGKAEAISYMGHPGITRGDDRYYIALVLNQILGNDTLASRLGTELRDRLGLTYGIYSDFDTRVKAGSFEIEVQTAPENANQAIKMTLALLRQIRTQGVTLDEVEAAKRAIISSYNVSLAHPDVLAGKILKNKVQGLPPDELQEFVDKINEVTQRQVNQVARELLHPDQIIVVTAGPKEDNH